MPKVRKAKDRDDSHDPGYIELANAIIAQAYKDYVDCEFASWGEVHTTNGTIDRKIPKMDTSGCVVSQEEIRAFFESQWYESLTDVAGSYILGLADKEISLIKRAIRSGMNYNMFVISFNRYSGFLDKADFSCTRSDYDTYRANTIKNFIVHKGILRYENRRDLIDEPEMTYYILDKAPAPGACQPAGIRKGVAIGMDTKRMYRYNHEKGKFEDIGALRGNGRMPKMKGE